MVFDSVKKDYKYSNTKLDAVINTIKKYKDIEKPIVFCHFKKEMEYLRKNLTQESFEDVINGDVSMDKRREIIDNHEKNRHFANTASGRFSGIESTNVQRSLFHSTSLESYSRKTSNM